MEGATFELMLFSYSSLLATTKTTIQAESIISAIISLLLILMFTPFSLRPLVYIGANLASD
jgi:hypothetical protein